MSNLKRKKISFRNFAFLILIVMALGIITVISKVFKSSSPVSSAFINEAKADVPVSGVSSASCCGSDSSCGSCASGGCGF